MLAVDGDAGLLVLRMDVGVTIGRSIESNIVVSDKSVRYDVTLVAKVCVCVGVWARRLTRVVPLWYPWASAARMRICFPSRVLKLSLSTYHRRR